MGQHFFRRGYYSTQVTDYTETMLRLPEQGWLCFVIILIGALFYS